MESFTELDKLNLAKYVNGRLVLDLGQFLLLPLPKLSQNGSKVAQK
jgi:hypothetical protein